MNTDCKHSTKLTGECVKCGEHPYEATMNTTTQIEIKKSANGFSASINGKTIMQFENPLAPYWFSSEITAERAANQQFLMVQQIEVSKKECEEACETAHNLVKLGRLRAYLLPVLAQKAKNIASAAACGISDFEAMKRSKEMLNRIESEES